MASMSLLKGVHAPLLALSILSLSISSVTQADVSLPRLLSDGAILQQGQPVPIWGWADEGETVKVTFAGKTLTTVAKDGKWEVEFPKQKAGTEHNLIVEGNNRLERAGLLMGDLWFAAGQSNIELPIRRVTQRYRDLVATTHLPNVREFNVPLLYSVDGPEEDFRAGQWSPATKDYINDFSAVGFFYARKLWEQTGIPQGVIRVPVGGSPIEAWLSESTLVKYPHYLEKLKEMQVEGALQKRIASDKANNDAWYAALQNSDTGVIESWEKNPVDPKSWAPVTMPGYLVDQGIDIKNGSVWLAKTIHLTAEQAAKGAVLWLGCIVDGDHTYINGVQVGSIGYQYPPRIYTVPQGVLKAGENTIMVRITTYSGKPGFVPDKTYALALGDESISLEGEWRYREAARMPSMQPGLTPHYIPSSLFNAKVAPALKLPIKGVLWYQGESNVGRIVKDDVKRLPSALCKDESCWGSKDEYRYLMTDLVRQYRSDFNNARLPVYSVQLANFLAANDEPSESGWAQTREAQRQTMGLPNTGMAVIIDTGEWNDIHPLNKQDVGERLALLALKGVYGQKRLVVNGPELKGIKRRGNELHLQFNSIGDGLLVKGDELKEIAIAGADKKFVWAKARVSKNTIVVSAEGIATPHWVRYAWADNPSHANLYNSAHLPASPFEAYVD